jgi:1-acyl-sn-glycerol-3-phosphate acyltransferase
MGVIDVRSRPAWPSSLAWSLLNALQLLFTIAVTVAGFPVALMLALLGGRRAALRMASWYWAPLLFAGAGARLKIEGLERVDWTRPLVLASNHQSMIDIAALFRAVPVPLRFALKRELAAVPVVGCYAKAMGMVFIDRGNARNARESLCAAIAHLRGASSAIVAFPEGTRSRDGSVGPFKGGAFQLAIEAGVPVVPVAIHGSGAVLPPSGFAVRPGTITVCFGNPIATEGLPSQDRNTLAQRTREAVAELLRGAR